jgi:hypothetical protein
VTSRARDEKTGNLFLQCTFSPLGEGKQLGKPGKGRGDMFLLWPSTPPVFSPHSTYESTHPRSRPFRGVTYSDFRFRGVDSSEESTIPRSRLIGGVDSSVELNPPEELTHWRSTSAHEINKIPPQNGIEKYRIQ